MTRRIRLGAPLLTSVAFLASALVFPAQAVKPPSPSPRPDLPAAAATANVDVVFTCLSLGWGRMECYVEGSGGTAPYSYAWNPGPYLDEGDRVEVYCSPYRWQTITVTATDSTGASVSCTRQFYCGEAP